MNLISAIDITSGALAAQRTRLDVVAQNIANAQTTRTPDGGPYKRQIVSFETELLKRVGGQNLQTVHIAGVSADRSEGERIQNPQHPDADKEGFVQMPNVNLAYEMVDLITASRAYEAGITSIESVKQMARSALAISK